MCLRVLCVHILLIWSFLFDLLEGRESVEITLFSTYVSWEMNRKYCNETGGQMISFIDQDQVTAMLIFTQPGNVWDGKFSSNGYWTGLISPKNTVDNSRYPYQWLDGCTTSLTVDTENYWAMGEPQQSNHAFCSCMVLASNELRLKAFGCSNSIPMACQRSNGPCTFEQITGQRSVTGADSSQVYTGKTISECQDTCERFTFDPECWALSFDPASSRCELFLTSGSAFFFDNKYSTSGSGDLYMKRCYKGVYISVHKQLTQQSSSEPNSDCKSTTTTSSVVDRYNLVAVSRPRAVINFYQQPLNRQEASDVCIEAGGHLAYLDSIIQDMVKDRIVSSDWAPTTEYVWIGLHDSTWDSGEAKTFYSGDSTSTGYLAMSTSSYDWLTQNEATSYQFICHKRIGDCVFPPKPNTGISSEIKETDIDSYDCQALCNSYKYQNDECWGITYDLNQRTCYFHFGSDAKTALDQSKYIDTTGRDISLYSRICYTFGLKNIPTTTQPSTPPTTQPSTPPTTQPSTEPPTTQPTTKPSTTAESAITTEPPTTEPSTSEPPTTLGPSTTQPTSQPPTTQPSTEPATTTQSPTTEPTTPEPPTTAEPPTTTEPLTIAQSASETATTNNVPTSTESTTVTNTMSSNPSTQAQQTGNTTLGLGSLPGNVNQTIETVCRCKCLVGPQLEIGSKQLEEKLDEITTELFVNPKTVSAARRKLTSVDDPRPSAKAIGSVLGITTLTVVFGFLICLDFQNIVTWFSEFRRIRSELRLSLMNRQE